MKEKKSDITSSFLKERPKTALLLVNVGVLSVLFLIAEIVLRLMGYEPGFVGADPGEYLNLQKVETLEEFDYYFTDSAGIYRAKTGPLSYDSTIVHNEDGFRSIPFTKVETEKTKLLLLGDSFTWGASAKPISECFANKIAEKGYLCYNSGIPGTEPNQYAKIAEHYAPILEPDITCLFFFMGNDIMDLKIEPEPFHNKYHITNAGWLNPYIDGEWVGDFQETYDYYFLRYEIPTGESWFNWLCSLTVVTTKVWQGIRWTHLLPHPYHPKVAQAMERRNQRKSAIPISYDYLVRSKDAAEKAGSKFYLFVIPQHDKLGQDIESKHPDLFRDLTYYLPETLEKSDYNDWPDGHLNNTGHQKYADFVLSILQQDGP